MNLRIILRIPLLILLFVLIDFVFAKNKLLKNNNLYSLGYEFAYKKLKETKGQERIILVGGSSLGWGVSSKRLTKELNILTVNTGIHGSMGLNRELRTVLPLVDKKKDILVFSPYSKSTYKKWIKSRSKEFCEIALNIMNLYPSECVGYSLNKLFRVIPLIQKKDIDYFREGFNEYGDYVFRREGINMVDKISNKDNCFEYSREDLVNYYIKELKSLKEKGYEIIYLPDFLPQVCNDYKIIKNYHDLFFEEFGIEGYESPKILFDSKYFYNGYSHLTSEGVKKRSLIFRDQIKTYLLKR